MSNVYILSEHGKLLKRGDALQLVREGEKRTIYPHRTDRLIVMGNVEFSSSALRLLMREQVDTIFLGRNGRFNGRIDFQEGKNVFLRQTQYQLLDSDWALNFARSVVLGKLHNQLGFLMRIGRKDKKSEAIEKQGSMIRRMIGKAEEATDLNELRGYEGNGARAYWAIFRTALLPDWAVFNGRSMHPPGDNVNAVLSFLYTMILFQVEAAVAMEGLDPYVGYMHTLDYGKKSLLFDLMEEYRTPIADTLAVAMFNQGSLNEGDFREVVFSVDDDDFPLESRDPGDPESAIVEEKKGVLLTKSGLDKVIRRLENKYDTDLYYKPLLRKLTYRKLIREQVRHFKRVISGEEAAYKPFQIR